MKNFAKIICCTAAVAVSSFSILATDSVQAATIQAQNGSFVFTDGLWEFTFLGSYGGYISQFGVTPPTQNVIVEANPGGANIPGSCSICSSVINIITATAPVQNQFFITGAVPGNGQTLTSPDGFLIIGSNNQSDATFGGSYVTSSSDPVPYKKQLQTEVANFFSGGQNQGNYVIGINDSFTGDKDYQDMIVSAKKVPVPAMVPGTILAGAFLSSKLMRDRKNAQKAQKVTG